VCGLCVRRDLRAHLVAIVNRVRAFALSFIVAAATPVPFEASVLFAVASDRTFASKTNAGQALSNLFIVLVTHAALGSRVP